MRLKHNKKVLLLRYLDILNKGWQRRLSKKTHWWCKIVSLPHLLIFWLGYIYLVRGVQVMLDIDLAVLYGVENRSLRQVVRRNIEKFPEDFLLKLKESEANDLISRGA